ncbi:MAG TPA: hypothetical protein VFE46_02025 [Pirellulales bacterium]|jgi:hypothetical protein|nr:hypothetical protein [Pirellulales bacterium]
MPDLNGNSWNEAGPAYDLSDRVSLLAHGALNVDGERYQLADGEEADVPDAGQLLKVRFRNGRWVYRSVEAMEVVVTTTRVRILHSEEVSSDFSVQAINPSQRPVAEDGENWPRWRRSEIVTLISFAIIVLTGLVWFLLTR